MRSSKRISALALVVVAAGLSLTACGPDDSSASGTTPPSSSDGAPAATLTPSGAAGQNDSSSSGSGSGSTGGSGSGSTGGSGSNSTGGSGSTSGGSGSSGSAGSSGSGSMCTTANLAISAEHGISGEGMELVHLKNTGSSSCTMHGFAGVDLKNGSDTVSVPRHSGGDVPTVRLTPGETTDFALYYPFNNSGGSGYTFTSMVITPPNETHSRTVSASINIPVSDQSTKSTELYLLAVGGGE